MKRAALAAVIAPLLLVAPRLGAEDYGLAAVLAAPQGAFADHVGLSGGLAGHALLARRGPLGLRLDGSAVLYGTRTERFSASERTRSASRLADEVTTDHWAFQVGLGPELRRRRGRVRPYAGVGAGVATLSTTSERRSGRRDDFCRDCRRRAGGVSTNEEDTAFAYGGTAGVIIPLPRRDVALDLGVRYGSAGRLRFLTEDDLVDTPAGLRTTPRRARPDLLEVRLGLAFR